MLDDTICCSPPSSRSASVHSARLRRSNKRQGKPKRCNRVLDPEESSSLVDFPDDPLVIHESEAPVNTINETFDIFAAMYSKDDKSQDVQFNSNECRDPFLNERLIVIADRAAPEASFTRLSPSFVSQGFVKLDDLNLSNNVCMVQSKDKKEIQIPGAETQFGITESEFFRVCDEAEVNDRDIPLLPSTSKHQECLFPPPAKKIEVTPVASTSKYSIVEQILNDFSFTPSPAAKPRPMEEETPVFKFKNQQIRTYANYRETRRKRRVACKLEDAYNSDSSDSSDLSLQYDYSQAVEPDCVDMNISANVAENLKNLSAFFSQSHSLDDNNHQIERNIQRNQLKIFVLDRFADDSGDFFGFSQDEIDRVSPFGCNLVKTYFSDEDDIFQDIRSPPFEMNENAREIEFSRACLDNILGDVDRMLEEADRHISFRFDIYESKHTNLGLPGTTEEYKCKLTSPEKPPPKDSNRKCATVVSGEMQTRFEKSQTVRRRSHLKECENWNDSDFLEEIATNVNSSLKKSEPQVDNFDSIEWNKEFCVMDKIEIKTSGQSQEKINFVVPNGGFATASKKPIVISEAARVKAERLLKEFEKEVSETFANDGIASIDGFKAISKNEMKFSKAEKNAETPKMSTGFTTASSKRIEISNIAMEKAEKIFAEVDGESTESVRTSKRKLELGESSVIVPKIAKTDICIDSIAPEMDKTPPISYCGFKTASSKDIKVSTDAIEKAKRMFEEIGTDPFDVHMEEDEILVPFAKRKKDRSQINSLKSPERVSTTNPGISRTPLNRIENFKLATHSESLSSSSLINRRNLLSLSKRKFKCPKSNSEFATPIKNPPKSLGPEMSPNLDDFFDSVSTSTPRVSKLRCNTTNVKKEITLTQEVTASTAALLEDEMKNSLTIDDQFSYLRQIEWNECDESTGRNHSNISKRTIPTSFNASGMNVILSDPNPSPKIRIKRLRMYERPPALSPILIANKCRPSGLRRNKSAVKNS